VIAIENSDKRASTGAHGRRVVAFPGCYELFRLEPSHRSFLFHEARPIPHLPLKKRDNRLIDLQWNPIRGV
jgi:hypothetical protein